MFFFNSVGLGAKISFTFWGKSRGFCLKLHIDGDD
jgi:hypothetical protein